MEIELSSVELANIKIAVSKEKFRELLESYIKNYGIGELFHTLEEITANSEKLAPSVSDERVENAKVLTPNAPLSENESLEKVQEEKKSPSLEKVSDNLNSKEIHPEVPNLTPSPMETNIPKTELGASIYAPNYIDEVVEDSKKNPQNFASNIPLDIPVIDTPKVRVLEKSSSSNYPDAKTVAPGEINY